MLRVNGQPPTSASTMSLSSVSVFKFQFSIIPISASTHYVTLFHCSNSKFWLLYFTLFLQTASLIMASSLDDTLSYSVLLLLFCKLLLLQSYASVVQVVSSSATVFCFYYSASCLFFNIQLLLFCFCCSSCYIFSCLQQVASASCFIFSYNLLLWCHS